ncbi:hypothetical protein H2200_011130 [Cladophialophora chaetospira]|uniref:Xanthine/uracil permease n=1 Tax=Cladophialophora chaetospira TaxID=386627 RepID=A0AA39CDI1_9EURO|nr:hypothetical protein H2200_011130 [Cladophialophora chaetospira]
MSVFHQYSNVINDYVATSTFGRVFRLQGCGHEKQIAGTSFLTELRAGVTTFFTMAYIIAVNASIISQTGGTCVCDASKPDCAKSAEYTQCVLGVQRDLITATATISGLASFMFGFLTNLPVALAPGMGLNAYFAYQVVGVNGSGPVPYRLALTAVFIEGFIFVFLSLVGMRQWLVGLIPSSLKIASTAGIGLFLTLIGLSTSAGLGVIAGAESTPLDLAGCPARYKDNFGACTSHKLQDPTVWIGIFCGGIITALLIMYKVKSAIIIGIAIVSIMSWPRSTSFTYFPDTQDGTDRFDFFKKVVTFHPIENILAAQDWNIAGAGSKFALALFTFLYVDILDCTGTLYSMAKFSGVVDEKTGSFPRSTLAYCTDAIMISIGSLLGTSPVTAFIESGAGIAEGGRTGLTAMTTGVCFLISIFFSPIFASIPPWATGCTLVLVGWMMARSIVDINWRYAGDALPAFVTLVFMPFSYSIAYGLIAGLMTYVALNGLTYVIKLISFGRILPADEDLKEYWSSIDLEGPQDDTGRSGGATKPNPRDEIASFGTTLALVIQEGCFPELLLESRD